ncbi:MAG: cyclic nucleotide-binding domain-containing protein [Mariprofundaceae bacterium]|nr:cyclic nucleotide-binding domain-containing protein [Mariprofundaceae bacterium]
MTEQMETLALPVLLRQARKLAFREEFKEAAGLYAIAIEHQDMVEVFDVRMRYAVCLEESVDYQEAMQQFELIHDAYTEQGETSAAEGIRATIQSLQMKLFEAEKAAKKKKLAETPIRHDDLLRMFSEVGKNIKFMPDEYICEVGELSNKIWLLKEGVLTIISEEKEVAPEEVYALNHEYVLLGERGYFTRQRRDVSVRAKTYSQVIEVSESMIQQMSEENPAFAVAVERLMRTTWVEPALARQDVFSRMNEMDRVRLAMSFKRKDLVPGEVLFEAGSDVDGTYLLQSGCLFFLCDDDGKDGQMSSVFPGDMVHLSGLIDGFSSRYKVMAATPVRLLHLSRKRFESFAEQRPWLLQAIMQHARQPARLQVTASNDSYLWRKERHLEGTMSF